jgi:hypothetical protein
VECWDTANKVGASKAPHAFLAKTACVAVGDTILQSNSCWVTWLQGLGLNVMRRRVVLTHMPGFGAIEGGLWWIDSTVQKEVLTHRGSCGDDAAAALCSKYVCIVATA